MSTELFYLIPNFLEYAKDYRSLSDDVVNHYYYDLKSFREYISHRKKTTKTKIEDIAINDVLSYIQTKKMTKITKWKFIWQFPKINTICNIRNSIHAFFVRCRIMDIQCLNPEWIPKIKKEYSRLNYLEDNEFKILLDCPRAIHTNKLAILRNELMLEVPYFTGLRRSEILQLNKECKKRLLPTPKEIFVWLDNKNFWNVITPKSVWNILIKYNEFCQKNNLLDKEVSIHMLRHSFWTMMMKQWIDIRIAQIFMRHKHITETQRYTHVKDELLQEQYQKFIKNM